MLNQTMLQLGQNRSVIREIFEYSKQRAAEIGADRVFDFSIGNPNVPPPAEVSQALRDLVQTADPLLLHGYSSAPGDLEVRRTIAASLQERFQARLTAQDLYMTAGAAAGLAITLKALCLPGDQVLLLAPFFPEYRVFAAAAQAQPVVVPPQPQSLQINFPQLERRLCPSTKAIIVNSPNNPSGVILSREALEQLCRLLEAKQEEYGHPIYIIADEPYRELVFDGSRLPWLPNLYANTIVCYSYSKSLSLPGERIGYIAVCEGVADQAQVYAALCGAGRALGYVCAPTLFQQVAARCAQARPDISVYNGNRRLLYESLSSFGFSCIRPQGAFYLFMQSPEPDANAFCQRAKGFELLLVPGDDFGCPGYVRIAFCVSPEQVRASLPAFQALARDYGLTS